MVTLSVSQTDRRERFGCTWSSETTRSGTCVLQIASECRTSLRRVYQFRVRPTSAGKEDETDDVYDAGDGEQGGKLEVCKHVFGVVEGRTG